MEQNRSTGSQHREDLSGYEPQEKENFSERLDNLKIGLSGWHQAYKETDLGDMETHIHLDGSLDDLSNELKHIVRELKESKEYRLQLDIHSVPTGLRELGQVGDDRFQLFGRLDGIASLPALPINYADMHSVAQDIAATLPQPSRFYAAHQLHIGDSRQGIVIPIFPLIEALEERRTDLTVVQF